MPTANDDSRRILELLAQEKITVDEADQLLRALKDSSRPADPGQPRPEASTKPSPRWMRVTIDRAARDGRPAKTVTIRMPLSIARSGLKLGAMFPRLAEGGFAERLREQGIDVDFSKIDPSQFDKLLDEMGEMDVDVDGGRAHLRIRCE
jgi:hypothetical protein